MSPNFFIKKVFLKCTGGRRFLLSSLQKRTELSIAISLYLFVAEKVVSLFSGVFTALPVNKNRALHYFIISHNKLTGSHQLALLIPNVVNPVRITNPEQVKLIKKGFLLEIFYC